MVGELSSANYTLISPPPRGDGRGLTLMSPRGDGRGGEQEGVRGGGGWRRVCHGHTTTSSSLIRMYCNVSWNNLIKFTWHIHGWPQVYRYLLKFQIFIFISIFIYIYFNIYLFIIFISIFHISYHRFSYICLLMLILIINCINFILAGQWVPNKRFIYCDNCDKIFKWNNFSWRHIS